MAELLRFKKQNRKKKNSKRFKGRPITIPFFCSTRVGATCNQSIRVLHTNIMKKTLFDVMIVYTDSIASSAGSKTKSITPFPLDSQKAHYNTAYAYLLQEIKKLELHAGFTTSKDIIGSGSFQNYWTWDKKKWNKSLNIGYAEFIYDKFSPINTKQRARRKMLFSKNTIRPFNNEMIFSLFFDKLKTYNELQQFSVPTVKIGDSHRSSVQRAVNNLKLLVSQHPNKKDFSAQIVTKDRFGAGGNQIYKIASKNSIEQITSVIKSNTQTQFIIQPFIKFDNGYSFKQHTGFIDIRIIYLDGKAVQTYIRIAKKNDFRCNEHQGGILEYTLLSELPTHILTLSNKIAGIINQPNALFALDFIVSTNGNVYLIEGNTGPGIDWNLSLKKNEKHAKKLIRLIAKSIFLKIQKNSDVNKTTMPINLQTHIHSSRLKTLTP